MLLRCIVYHCKEVAFAFGSNGPWTISNELCRGSVLHTFRDPFLFAGL
jgi:hypothetical protein